MTVERSGRGALTTNAYTNSYNDVSVFRIIDSQWEYRDIYTLQKSLYILGDGQTDITCYAVSWAGTYVHSSDNPLEWAVDIYDSTGNTRLYISDYYDPTSIIDVGLPTVSAVPNTQFVYRLNLLVRRKSGSPIYREDMYASTFTWYLNHSENVEDNTLPNNWFDTTMATFQNPMDTYTTIIPTDYDISSSQYDPLLEIPSKIDAAINFIILGFGRIMNFRYISFVVCFVLIVGLVAWLIH